MNFRESCGIQDFLSTPHGERLHEIRIRYESSLLKLHVENPDKESRETDKKKGLIMYNYMVFNVADRVLYKDFLSYYKRCEDDDYYIVSLNNPKLMQYLEAFLERRLN